MKDEVNCASGKLLLYANESLEPNQINTLPASVESVCIHLRGTQNQYGLKSEALIREYSTGSIVLMAQSGWQH